MTEPGVECEHRGLLLLFNCREFLLLHADISTRQAVKHDMAAEGLVAVLV